MRGVPKEKRRTRGLSKFKRSDLTKAAQAAIAAGLPVRGIDVDPTSGKITVLIGEPAIGDAAAIKNPWDEVANEDQADQNRPAKALRVQQRQAR